MKHLIYVCFVLPLIFLMVSCTPQGNNNEQPQAEQPEISSLPSQTSLPAAEIPTSTITPSPSPTLTPTLFVVDPVLNGTPSAPLDGPIEKSNVDRVQIIRMSGSQRDIVVLGKSGDRWYSVYDGNLLVHDTKTGELIWQTDLAPNLNQINHEGTTAFKIYDEKIQIAQQDGETKEFEFPNIAEMENGSPAIAINFEKKLYAVGVNTPFFYNGPPIPFRVYKWGNSSPIYKFTGNYFGFSTNGNYLTYLVGRNLQVADAGSGKLLTEFGMNNENSRWKTSWDEKYIAFSRSSTVEIWRLEDRKLIRILQEKSEKEGQAFAFKFSADSQSVLVLQPGKTIRTWSIPTGEMLQEEKTDESDLNRIGILNDGNVVHYDLPQVPGREWISDINQESNFSFSNDGKSLLFSIQTVKYGGTTEKCNWELNSPVECDFQEDQIWTLPANYKLLTIGNDNNTYYMKSRAEPISLHEGWDEGGKFIAQIPKISVGEWGYLARYRYYPETGIIISNYSDGKIFIYNSKTNGRLLLDGNFDRFFPSSDGSSLFEIVNMQSRPTEMEFVQYDIKSLKEISRTPLEKTIHPLASEKVIPDLVPQLVSARLAPDGKALFAYVTYSSETKTGSKEKPILLTIPLDDFGKATIKELEISLGEISNLLVSQSGDLAIIANAGEGNLYFIETASGKIVNQMNIGGYPIKLAISPDGELIAAADMYYGIQLLGVPRE